MCREAMPVDGFGNWTNNGLVSLLIDAVRVHSQSTAWRLCVEVLDRLQPRFKGSKSDQFAIPLHIEPQPGIAGQEGVGDGVVTWTAELRSFLVWEPVAPSEERPV